MWTLQIAETARRALEHIARADAGVLRELDADDNVEFRGSLANWTEEERVEHVAVLVWPRRVGRRTWRRV